MKVWGVCVFGCDVFMCVVGTHVASVCARLETRVYFGVRLPPEWIGMVCERTGLSRESK